MNTNEGSLGESSVSITKTLGIIEDIDKLIGKKFIKRDSKIYRDKLNFNIDKILKQPLIDWSNVLNVNSDT